jgi:hypothetical protein
MDGVLPRIKQAAHIGIKPRGGGEKEKLILKAGRKPPLRPKGPKRSASFFRSSRMENERTEKNRERNKNNTVTHTQISVRLSDELLDQIQRLVEKERQNRSNMIEYLLREMAKK